MNEEEKPVARSCLKQIYEGMLELRALKSWWRERGVVERDEFHAFLADVQAYRVGLK